MRLSAPGMEINGSEGVRGSSGTDAALVSTCWAGWGAHDRRTAVATRTRWKMEDFLGVCVSVSSLQRCWISLNEEQEKFVVGDGV